MPIPSDCSPPLPHVSSLGELEKASWSSTLQVESRFFCQKNCLHNNWLIVMMMRDGALITNWLPKLTKLIFHLRREEREREWNSGSRKEEKRKWRSHCNQKGRHWNFFVWFVRALIVVVVVCVACINCAWKSWVSSHWKVESHSAIPWWCTSISKHSTDCVWSKAKFSKQNLALSGMMISLDIHMDTSSIFVKGKWNWSHSIHDHLSPSGTFWLPDHREFAVNIYTKWLPLDQSLSSNVGLFELCILSRS